MTTTAGKPRMATRARARRSLARRIGRIIGTTLLAIVALLGVLVGYLHTNAGKARVRGLLQEKLAARVNGSVEIGTLDYALGGTIRLGAVRLRDEAGVEVIALDELAATPAWSDLIRGDAIALREVSLRGLHLTVTKDADGGSNLARLFKPSPPPAEPKKPLSKPIDVRALRIEDVGVRVRSADGTEVVLSGLGTSGAVHVLPSAKDYSVSLDPLTLALEIRKPSEAGVLRVALDGLRTGVAIRLVRGVGSLALLPLEATVKLTAPPAGEKSFPFRWGGVNLAVTEGDLSATLDKLVLGAVTLASLELRSRRGADGLEGTPSGALVGLHVAAEQVNALLGRALLGADLDLAAELGDESGVAALKLELEVGGGTLTLLANADPRGSGAEPERAGASGATAASPGGGGVAADMAHDVRLSLRAIDTEKMLAPEAAMTPVRIESFDLHAKGRGKDLDSLATALELEGSGIRVRAIPIDRVRVTGRFENGKVEIDRLEVDAVGQRLRGRGTYGVADKAIDLALSLDGDVGVALRELRTAGLPVKTALPPSLVRLPADDLRVGVRGRVGGALEVTAKAERLALLGGTARLDARVAVRQGDPARGEKKVAIEGLDTLLDVRDVRLSSLLALRGKKLPAGLDARARLRVTATGTLAEPDIRVTAGAETLRDDGGARLAVALDARASDAMARVDLDAERVGEPKGSLLEVRGRLPIALAGPRPGLDTSRPVDLDVKIARRSLASLVELVPPALLRGRSVPSGEIALDAHVGGTLARPDAKANLDLVAALLAPEAGAPEQRITIDATVAPSERVAGGLDANATLGARLDRDGPEIVKGQLTASLSRSPLVGRGGELQYGAHIEVPTVSLADLPDLPKLARVRRLGGALSATIDVTGNRHDLGATVVAEATGLRPAGAGPIDGSLRLGLGPNEATVGLQVGLANSPLATLDGTVGLAGQGLLARLKEGLDPSLDLTLDVPERTLASLGALRPALAKAPGSLSGSVHVGGRVGRPLVESSFALGKVKMMDGSDGGAAIAIALDAETLRADVGIGADAPGTAPVKLAVQARRAELESFAKGEPLQIEATARADQIDLRRLVPALLREEVAVEPEARLDWDMRANVELEMAEGKVRVAKGQLDGTLGLDGKVPLPGTRRVWDDIALRLVAEPNGIRLEKLHLHEADGDDPNRTLTLSGRVGLDALKPVAAELRLESRRWLLFGGGPVGPIDAPRGTLDIDARLEAQLDRPIREVSVDVRKLELLIPERFPKAHQPEEVHVGDLIRLGQGVALGKLPVPKSVAEKAEASRQTAASPVAARASAPASAAAAAGAGTPDSNGEPSPAPVPETGLNLRVHIAKGSHLLQAPIDLITGGDIALVTRPTGRHITGKLVMTGGELELGGKRHALTKGSLIIDDEHPKGWVDLWFERPLPVWQQREVSQASAGTAIRIHMFGPPTDRTTVLGGAGSPGTLLDLLAMHNEGRPLYVTAPDMPQSVSVEFPQEQGLLVVSFMSLNLPHLLFLDRVAAWADPYDSPKGYGHVEHWEAEGFFADGQGRVRVGKQPAGVGRSEAEIEVDYLPVNERGLLFGVGLTGGSRAGGGPGVVLEWSSDD